MDQYLLAVLISLGAGALYASLSSGLLMTYRSSGVVNFGHGAVVMYAAYMYSELRTTGRWVVPPLPNPLVIVQGVGRIFGAHWSIPSWPTFIDLGGPMGTPLAMLISVGTGGLLGLVIYLIVFRPMRHAPPLAKVIASIGVLLSIQAVVVLRYGTEPRTVDSLLPTDTITVLGQTIPVDRLILAGVGIALAVVLSVVYARTRFGWATEATAANEKGAIAIGLSPGFVAGVNWFLAALVGSALGILVVPVTALSPDNFPLFVLPALAAMLLGGLRSFVVAALASFGVAAVQGVVVLAAANVTWLPPTGLANGLPLILTVLAMIIRGKRLPTRDSAAAERLPAAPEPRVNVPVTVTLICAVIAGALFLPFAYRTALVNSAIGVILGLSLVLLVGLVGQISLMQMALAGAAAVIMTRATSVWHIPFPFAPLLAALAAAAAGVVAAIPALRIRGTHLAVVTLAGAYAFDSMVLQSPTFVGGDADSVRPPSLGGFSFGISDTFAIGRGGTPNPAFVLFVLLVTGILCYLYINTRRGLIGRRFLAVRSNERAAAAAGIHVSGTKILAFAMSGFAAGVAGALATYQFESVSQPTFATFTSLTAIAFAYLGGIGRLSGALASGLIVGGGLVSVVLDDLVHSPQYYGLIGGVGLVIAAVQQPEGIAGFVAAKYSRVRERLRPSTAAVRQAPEVSDRAA
jgi:branched-chain amino acid transport system permease protein